eukprot:3063951-Karenia_brevis.AAC.1
MLSGESANGTYPVESIRALGSIAVQADKHVAMINEGRAATVSGSSPLMGSIKALAYSAVRASQELQA